MGIQFLMISSLEPMLKKTDMSRNKLYILEIGRRQYMMRHRHQLKSLELEQRESASKAPAEFFQIVLSFTKKHLYKMLGLHWVSTIQKAYVFTFSETLMRSSDAVFSRHT